MKKLVRPVLALFLLGSMSCVVGKKKFDKQVTETDSCYDALRKENTRKKELATALTDLKTKLQDVADERARLAEAKGELEGNLASLEKSVEDQLSKIGSLTEEKKKLEEEKEALKAKTETYDELVGSLKREMEQKLIDVRQEGQRVIVNVSDQILFDSGSTVIKSDGKGALAKIAEILARVEDRRIDVEGHTDNIKISGKLAQRYPTNWELSASRATNVVRFLEANGVDPTTMAAVGKSKHRPVAKNDTPEGRRANRRIEIVLTPSDVKKSM